MFLLNGQPISPDAPFVTPDGTQYPANWIRLSSPEERAAIGITEVPDPPTWDQRFYWGYDQDGKLIPKDHTQLVEQWSSQTNQTAYTLLLPTDWMIVRETDDGTPVDAGTKSWRQLIRTACAAKVSAIVATTTTDELAAFVTSADYSTWPTKGDVNRPYPSWTQSPLTGKWPAPVPYPTVDENGDPVTGTYEWDEASQTWQLVPPIDESQKTPSLIE